MASASAALWLCAAALIAGAAPRSRAQGVEGTRSEVSAAQAPAASAWDDALWSGFGGPRRQSGSSAAGRALLGAGVYGAGYDDCGYGYEVRLRRDGRRRSAAEGAWRGAEGGQGLRA